MVGASVSTLMAPEELASKTSAVHVALVPRWRTPGAAKLGWDYRSLPYSVLTVRLRPRPPQRPR